MVFGGNGGGSASCSPVQPRRSRRRSRLPLHVGRLRTDVHVLERNVFNLVIELGSLVEETRSEFGVAGLLGEPQERGRLPESFKTSEHTSDPTSPIYRATRSSVTRNSFQKIDVPVLHIPGLIQTCPQRGQAATNPSLCANRHAELRSYLAMSATIE